MDKQQAKEIIKETFESSFDKDRFKYFIKNLLNHIEEDHFEYRGIYLTDAFKEYIQKLERIGKYIDSKEKKIDILIVYLKKETSLDHARTMQRNFIAHYLNGSRGGQLKDAALVAYVSPNKIDWRFSLVKMDYKFEKTKTGKMKVKEEFTPARRWSFLVGVNEKSHTAQSQLVNILKDDEHDPTLEEIEKAFDIETVTKEFFLKYRELFLRTKEDLDKVVKNDPKIKADFEKNGVDTVNFAKKLLGQIIFLYFLQKKGWFGVGRDDVWGTGSKHFLRELFKKKHGDYNNFFNDILEPLFYEALRRDRSDDDGYYSRFNCKIPFLNGGLFDPIGNYDWFRTDIIIPDKLFSNSLKTKEDDTGTGILDVFDRYNFTVKEDEPLEKEVAIDPELLGKSYEKFNAIRPDNFDEFQKALKSGKKGEENKFNKKFGVYYTPREIVHYMCQQSLINYLNTKANEAKLSSHIKKTDFEDLIEVGELISEYEATALIKQEKIKNGIQKSSEYTLLLSDSIRENAKAIDEWLENITVCDPAVGSGAFPVGMMSEIVKTRNVLSTYFINNGLKPIVASSTRSIYDFKRHCIEHSLYGVDIDPGAVEIAKLRLWLSLIVDETPNNSMLKPAVAPKPLPNLDYKIVCGNSLLGVEKNLFNNELFKELEKLKPLFFNETNPTKKRGYKNQIDKLISEITNGHTEFDFEVYFSEVFHEKKIEKNWQAYHITWVTHNSRVSEEQYSKQHTALAVGSSQGIWLSDKSRETIAKAITEKIKERNYRVLAVNVLADHVHCVVVCEENELVGIVQQLKGYSSYEHNRLVQLSVEGEGRQIKLWAKGSSKTLLESEHHMLNAIEYVENNHLKHDLPEIASSAYNQQLKQSVVGLDRAFAPVIEKGGFDVVIANPPYVVLPKKYFSKTYRFIKGNNNTYIAFLERALMYINNTGVISYIIPTTWLAGNNFKELRKFFLSNGLIQQIVQLPYDIFENAYVDNLILVLTNSKRKNKQVITFKFQIKDEVRSAIEYDTFSIKEWLNDSEHVIFLNKQLNELLFKYKNIKSIKLEKIAGIQRGTLPPKQNELYNYSENNKQFIPWFDGQVYRYFIKKGNSFRVIYNNLNENKPLELFTCEKLFGRQLISRQFRLQFSYFNEIAAFKKNLYAIYNLQERFYYFYVLAILNSTFYSYVQVNLNTSGQRDDYPAFSLQDYKYFLIPELSSEDQNPYVDIVTKILYITKDDDYLQNNQKKAKVKALEAEIDQLVYKLYNLTEEEIKIVEGF